MLAMPPDAGLPRWAVDRVRGHQPVVTLRDYQDEAVDAVAVATGGGRQRVMVVLATGGGKTVVFGALTWSWLADGMGRVLILAHRDELIQQAVSKLALWVPRHLIGIVKARENQVDAPVVVASIQTLANSNRLAQAGSFGLIVVDEAHHAAAASYRTILSQLGVFDPGGPLLVGVTATPKRGDGVGLEDVFEEVVYQRTYTDLVTRGWLVPSRSLAFDLMTAPAKPKLGIDGDFAEGWLEGVMLGANAPDKIVEAWKDYAPGRPTLVFTPTVSVAKAVAEAFTGAGVAGAWVSGAMPLTDRRAILSKLRDGTIKVVANAQVLTEGFDEPSVSCIVVGRPTKNAALYIQMVGRGTRLHPESGKRDCLILDMMGCSDQLQLDALVELGGRGPQAARDSLMTARRGDSDVPFSVQEGQLVARQVAPVRPACRWVSLSDGYYALSMLTHGWVVLKPDAAGTWSVIAVSRRGKDGDRFDEQVLDYAKVAGEGIARNLGAFGPMTRRASWLDRPLSEKAFRYLSGTGLPITEETTAWESTVMQAERELPRWRGL